MLFSLGSMAAYGYDPDNGKELWRLDTIGSYTSVMTPGRRRRHRLWPLRLHRGFVCIQARRREGRIRPEEHPLENTKAPSRSSPRSCWSMARIYMMDDQGVAVCLDAKKGKPIWKERVGGEFAASPICNRGKIYFFDKEGKTTIIEASKKFTVVAENKLDEGLWASPAVSGDALYLRTPSSLYCIKNK